MPEPTSSAARCDHSLEEERIQRVYASRARGDFRYSWSNPSYLHHVQDRERVALREMARAGLMPLESWSILDVGCGTGAWIRDLIRWGARPERIAGVDLLPDRIEEARALCPAAVELRCGSATELPFESSSFDLVLQATVFSSILDPGVRAGVAGEMARVVKPGGCVVWYDFWADNPRNPDVRGVRAREIRELFPEFEVRLARVTLAPPLARRLAPRSALLCEILARVPLLKTHLFGIVRRPS